MARYDGLTPWFDMSSCSRIATRAMVCSVCDDVFALPLLAVEGVAVSEEVAVFGRALVCLRMERG